MAGITNRVSTANFTISPTWHRTPRAVAFLRFPPAVLEVVRPR
jgi:hypothetical protein